MVTWHSIRSYSAATTFPSTCTSVSSVQHTPYTCRQQVMPNRWDGHQYWGVKSGHCAGATLLWQPSTKPCLIVSQSGLMKLEDSSVLISLSVPQCNGCNIQPLVQMEHTKSSFPKRDKSHSKTKMGLQCQCQSHRYDFPKELFIYAYICVYLRKISFQNHDLRTRHSHCKLDLWIGALEKRSSYNLVKSSSLKTLCGRNVWENYKTLQAQ